LGNKTDLKVMLGFCHYHNCHYHNPFWVMVMTFYGIVMTSGLLPFIHSFVFMYSHS